MPTGAPTSRSCRRTRRRPAQYQLEFHVDDYLKARPGANEADIFMDNPVVRFAVFDAKQHYHVPMLCAPGNFATYRGS